MTISLLLFPRSTRLSLIDPATWTTRLSARGCDRDKSPTSREATPVRSADWTTGKPPRGGPYRAEVPLLSLPLSFSLPHPSLPPQPPSHPSRPFHSISLSISVLLCSFLFHRLSVFYSSTFFPPVRDTRYFLYSSSLSCFKLALWKVNPSPGIPFSLPLSLCLSFTLYPSSFPLLLLVSLSFLPSTWPSSLLRTVPSSILLSFLLSGNFHPCYGCYGYMHVTEGDTGRNDPTILRATIRCNTNSPATSGQV